MKNIIYLLLIMCTAFACSSPTSPDSGGTNEGPPPIEPSAKEEIVEEVMVSDGTNSKTLTFGILEEATAEYHSDEDIEGPPFTPPGAFFAYFTISDKDLFKDIKSNSPVTINWRLQFAPQGDEGIELTWDIDAGNVSGTLVIQEKLNEPSVSIDMLSNTSYTLDPSSFGNELFIVYNRKSNKYAGTAAPSNRGNVMSGNTNSYMAPDKGVSGNQIKGTVTDDKQSGNN